jgi:hypothetical protein
LKEKVVPENTIEEDIIECTICAEPIPCSKSTLFFGVEINPACNLCKPPSEPHSENLPSLTKADLERNHGNNDLTPKERIRLKVQKKLRLKFESGEINREEMRGLEEELVRDLEKELVKNL